ncbi:signal peptidase I [Dactylosporangium siamense]|uniref:Signal peptidase I n=1 Tax=Dactylosporangium siamense TaxID=685454 RepID=A0A919PWM8_9ACTN|nr:signal peptidase I [Dactylosporangium siamense]GIG49973.1 S26 family signal peptidase [Dactylosporangium siamense]
MILGGLAVLLGLAAAAIWAGRRFVVVTVDGGSMLPTFSDGDRVLVRRTTLGRIRTGDVVVMRYTPGPHTIHHVIKRAVAVPGDPVPRDRVPPLADVPEPAVPPGRLVLLGDSPISTDSRHYGYAEERHLLGVVVRRMSVPAAGRHGVLHE